MGQKVNPHGLRVGVIKNWDCRWFASDEKFGDTLVQDYKVREFLKKKLFLAGIPKIEIERAGGRVKVFVHCARPGAVIGKGGTEIERLRLELEKKLAAEIIDGYGDVAVTADDDDPTVCRVSFQFAVAHGLNQIYLRAYITV